MTQNSNQKNRWFIDPKVPAEMRDKKWGDHAVCAIGYTEKGLIVISWGEKILVDWNFYTAYNDESYAALSTDWFDKGHTPHPDPFSFDELSDIIEELQG